MKRELSESNKSSANESKVWYSFKITDTILPPLLATVIFNLSFSIIWNSSFPFAAEAKTPYFVFCSSLIKELLNVGVATVVSVNWFSVILASVGAATWACSWGISGKKKSIKYYQNDSH